MQTYASKHIERRYLKYKFQDIYTLQKHYWQINKQRLTKLSLSFQRYL